MLTYSIVATYCVMLSLTLLLFLFSGELRNLVGSILGGQTGSSISLEQVRLGEVRVWGREVGSRMRWGGGGGGGGEGGGNYTT